MFLPLSHSSLSEMGERKRQGEDGVCHRNVKAACPQNGLLQDQDEGCGLLILGHFVEDSFFCIMGLFKSIVCLMKETVKRRKAARRTSKKAR